MAGKSAKSPKASPKPSPRLKGKSPKPSPKMKAKKSKEIVSVEQVEEMVAEKSTIDLAALEQDIKLMREVATVDPGHLAVFDPTPIDASAFRKDKDSFLKSHTCAAIQMLVRQLKTLPQEKVAHSIVAELPKPQTITPREKPIPKAKPLTRWQKFAQEKGITKKKRSVMEYDELREEYRPRHGYGKVNDDKDDWLLPHKEGKGDDYDPWEERAEAKRSKKEKQTMQEQRNMKEAKEGGYVAPLTTSVLDGSKQGKGELADTLAVVQRSSASMGKFDRRRKGEAEIKAPRGKRHKVSAAVGTSSELKSEKTANLETLEKMMRGEKTSEFNANKAANYQQVDDEESGRTKKKKAGGDGKKRRSIMGKPANKAKRASGGGGLKKKGQPMKMTA